MYQRSDEQRREINNRLFSYEKELKDIVVDIKVKRGPETITIWLKQKYNNRRRKKI